MPCHDLVFLKNEALYYDHRCCLSSTVLRASLILPWRPFPVCGWLPKIQVQSRYDLGRNLREIGDQAAHENSPWCALVWGWSVRAPPPGHPRQVVFYHHFCHEENSTVESDCRCSCHLGLAHRLGLASGGRAGFRNAEELNWDVGQRLGFDDEPVDHLSGEQGMGDGRRQRKEKDRKEGRGSSTRLISGHALCPFHASLQSQSFWCLAFATMLATSTLSLAFCRRDIM